MSEPENQEGTDEEQPESSTEKGDLQIASTSLLHRLLDGIQWGQDRESLVGLQKNLPKQGDIAVFADGTEKEVYSAWIEKTPSPFSITKMHIKFCLGIGEEPKRVCTFSDSFELDGSNNFNSIIGFKSA